MLRALNCNAPFNFSAMERILGVCLLVFIPSYFAQKLSGGLIIELRQRLRRVIFGSIVCSNNATLCGKNAICNGEEYCECKSGYFTPSGSANDCRIINGK